MTIEKQVREQLNGFDKRLMEVEKLETKVTRNESDIQKIFEELAKIPQRINTLVVTMLFSGVISIGVATWAIVSK